MYQLLPFTLLASFLSLFGLLWIITGVDPQKAPITIFVLFIILLFVFIFNSLGIALYFLRTKIYKRYDKNWYFKTSFKMAFFIALFPTILAVFALSNLLSLFNIMAGITVLILFALWSFLGKKK